MRRPHTILALLLLGSGMLVGACKDPSPTFVFDGGGGSAGGGRGADGGAGGTAGGGAHDGASDAQVESADAASPDGSGSVDAEGGTP